MPERPLSELIELYHLTEEIYDEAEISRRRCGALDLDGRPGDRAVGPIGAAAGIAGAAIGTAADIATAPFRGAYAYDRRGYYDPYYGRRW